MTTWIKTKDSLPTSPKDIIFYEWAAEQLCGLAHVGIYLSSTGQFENNEGAMFDVGEISHWAWIGDLCELREQVGLDIIP